MGNLIKSLVIILVITLLGVGGVLVGKVWMDSEETTSHPDQPEIIPYEKLEEMIVIMDPITTNLKSGEFIKTQWTIQATSKDYATDLNNLQFQVKSSIIKSLGGLSRKEVQGAKGLTLMENTILKAINTELKGNYVAKVYAVNKLVQ